MLLSMTGYGRGQVTHGRRNFIVELRSLNSKQTDLRLRCAHSLGAYELKLRKRVTDFAQRGKLELQVDIRHEDGEDGLRLNMPLLKRLHEQIDDSFQLDPKVGQGALLAGLVRLPKIVDAQEEELDQAAINALEEAVTECLNNFRNYRRQEGRAMAEDLRQRAQSIIHLLDEVEPHEQARVVNVRERLERQLEDFKNRQNVDQSRYEQEVLYYLEKIDINEEKVRLRQNCDYFLEVLGNDQSVKGRKLSFIAQEMGREINTLGAKANSSDIQRLVVNMKEQHEQIKEQLANVV